MAYILSFVYHIFLHLKFVFIIVISFWFFYIKFFSAKNQAPITLCLINKFINILTFFLFYILFKILKLNAGVFFKWFFFCVIKKNIFVIVFFFLIMWTYWIDICKAIFFFLFCFISYYCVAFHCCCFCFYKLLLLILVLMYVVVNSNDIIMMIIWLTKLDKVFFFEEKGKHWTFHMILGGRFRICFSIQTKKQLN